MKPDLSSNRPVPTPRTNPLIVDHLVPKQFVLLRAYVEQHGGTWIALADGGYQINFPSETQQWLEWKQESSETYAIQFPDGAALTWYRRGRISPINGLPQGMSSTIAIPVGQKSWSRENEPNRGERTDPA